MRAIWIKATTITVIAIAVGAAHADDASIEDLAAKALKIGEAMGVATEIIADGVFFTGNAAVFGQEFFAYDVGEHKLTLSAQVCLASDPADAAFALACKDGDVASTTNSIEIETQGIDLAKNETVSGAQMLILPDAGAVDATDPDALVRVLRNARNQCGRRRRKVPLLRRHHVCHLKRRLTPRWLCSLLPGRGDLSRGDRAHAAIDLLRSRHAGL